MNRIAIPDMTPQELAARLTAPEPPIVLDVREPFELLRAKLHAEVALAPLSELAADGPDALPAAAQDKAAEIVVLCHHGNRSMQVAMWLRQQGWENVYNLAGGIHAYALQVDRSVGVY